jgi:putative DNA primase/helicase
VRASAGRRRMNVIDAKERIHAARAAKEEASQNALALAFAERHGATLVYTAASKKWLAWAGALEITVAVTAKLVSDVLTLAKSDRRIAGTWDMFDRDLWLLNTPGGTIDLRTGVMREHRPGDYITKITSVTPGAMA